MDKEQLFVPEVSITHPLLSLHWEELPQLPWGMHSAKSVWHNGCLFVGGGIVEGVVGRRELATLCVYSHQQWRRIDTPTYCYGMAVFRERITLVGGREYPSYDLTNKVWQLQSSHGEDGGEEWKDDAIPPMATKRRGASAVAHHNSLLVAGGYDGKNNVAIVEVFSSQLQQWLSTTSLPRPCSDMSSTVVGSHLVFAGGEEQGRECYCCSMEDILSSSLQWERLADLPLSRTSITTHNGVLLAIGGYDGSSRRSAMFVFSVSTQRWRHFFDLPLPLSHTSTPTGNIIAIGGYSDSRFSSKVFKLYLQDEAALGLSNIILRGVQNGLYALVERALTAVKEHFHSSQPVDGSLLLDFLAHSSSPNVSSIKHSCSPLMIACANEDTKMVDVLLENGASPSYKNKDDVTAVHVACSKDNLKLVQQLVDSNGGLTLQATTNLLQMTDKDGQTVLHYSCGSHFGGETLKWLLKNETLCGMLNNRTNIGLTPLLTACHHGNEAAVEQLVSQVQVDTAVCDENDRGALHLAAQHDSSPIVELLLKKGCPSDTQDSEGNTALHIAHKKSSNSVITVLTDVDNGRVSLIMNKAGQLPADIEPDDIIPPEILKKGPKAVDLYFEALKKGSEKIPWCNFLILGEERVGKTSLYHLLVNKPFNPNQESTRGIDNAIVDTMVDTRNVGVEDWAEKDESTVKQHADQQFVLGVIGALPSDLLSPSNGSTPTVTESDLEEELSKLVPEIQQILSARKNPPPPTKVKRIQPTQQPHTQPEDKPQAQPTQPIQQPPQSQKTNNDSSTQQETHHSSPSLAATEENPSSSYQSTQPVKAIVPKVNIEHAKLINEALKATTTSMERKGPVLILNVLDFAGQNQYRPMHHCFLTRRAMYLVVFNLQHIIVYICQLKSQQSVPSDKMVANPFEQIRYWLHSIHAHTLPAVPGKEKEPLKNVCLVGTHRQPRDKSKGKPLRNKQLQEISDLIKKELEDDDRCISHLHFVGPNSDRIFAAVENSIEDRESSGAKALQEEIKTASRKLSFLNEEYPVVWYRFNTELARLKESLKEKESSLVVTVGLVLKIATQCGITDPAGQDLALEFYHETGKIVCLKFLPPLFISEEEHAELKELVLLDPKWLIDVMMNVVELNFRSTIKNKDINQLRETGVASCYLLKEAWSDYLREPLEQSFRQMCLMLQAEALIHPIRIIPKSAPEQSPSDPAPTSEAPPRNTLPATSKTATTDADEKPALTQALGYLVPGKLPEKIKEKPVKVSGWTTFYFDFQRFLPREIYHRLVCLLLAVTQKKKSFVKPYLSKNMCQFKNFDNCHLCITFEEEHHRLKISVLTSDEDPRSLTDHIHTIHTEYLRKICTRSNLEGLRYVGGPLLNCGRCGETNVVKYVNYYEREDLLSESTCPECLMKYDVNQLLRLSGQIKPQETTHGAVHTTGPVNSALTPSLIDVTSSSFKLPPEANVKRDFQPCSDLKGGDYSATTLWELNKIHPLLDGRGITIAILDTGIDIDHAAFTEKRSTIVGCSIEASTNWYNSKDPHGSMTAHVACGREFRTESRQLIPSGVAPGANLRIYHVGKQYPTASLKDVLKSVFTVNEKSKQEKQELTVDIISMSFGLKYDSSKDGEFAKLLSDLTSQGVICVASAGNDGGYQSGSFFPASDGNVISVGALDIHGRIAPSNPTDQSSIDVYAPGEQIPAPLVGTTNSKGVQYFNGSSCAAPAVAGLIALVLQFERDKRKLLGDIYADDLFNTNFRDLNYLKNIVLKDKMKRGDSNLLHPCDYFLETCGLKFVKTSK